MKTVLLVGIGGFIGSVSRYFVSKLNVSVELFSIPIGTLAVNIIGSYIIGVLAGIAEKSVLITPELRLLLMVGFCGGFTTFSSFANENIVLMHNAQFLSLLFYTGISILLGFTAVYLGYNTSNIL